MSRWEREVKTIADFLPSPEELALKDEIVKVTIALSKASVDFFKNEAKKYNTQYQKMIRRLLDVCGSSIEHVHNQQVQLTARAESFHGLPCVWHFVTSIEVSCFPGCH